jgi:asparagine synthase (glutamine-hydrolysing)
MCGILGSFSRDVVNPDIIKSMGSCLSPRGPDDEGIYVNYNSGIVMFHKRLSIIDLSSQGHQPMTSANSRWVISYNGEIYNHLDIRKAIASSDLALSWKGSSDTETLISAIEVWGLNKTLESINGMFAFALWDKKEETLYLVRDRMGEKPLYYGKINNIFFFTSDLKALELHPEWKGIVDRDALSKFMRYGHVPAPLSIYKNIKKLLPGHFVKIKKYGYEISELVQYWSVKEKINTSKKNYFSDSNEIEKNLDLLIKDSVRKRMIADVPVGAFLSGGVDSSLIVAQMQSLSKNKIKTFCIGNIDQQFNEAQYASEIAKYIGTDHHELMITSKDALDVIPKIPLIYDEPFADASQIPTYLVSKLTKQHVSVALTGDGGDELFGGYERLVKGIKLWGVVKYIPHIVRKLIAKGFVSNKISVIQSFLFNLSFIKNPSPELKLRLYKVLTSIDAKNALQFYDLILTHWKDKDIVADQENLISNFSEEISKMSVFEQFSYKDLTTYLPDCILTKVDRASMSVSLETRIPYLDHQLIEFSFKIPEKFKVQSNKGKWILRKVLERYVPLDLFDRPKKGFTVPLAQWLAGPLRDWAEILLSEINLKKDGFFNSEIILAYWSEFLRGNSQYEREIWCVLMFQVWKNSKKTLN